MHPGGRLCRPLPNYSATAPCGSKAYWFLSLCLSRAEAGDAMSPERYLDADGWMEELNDAAAEAETQRLETSHIGLLRPTVVTDGGPWADHDMPCAVCRTRPAVLDLASGVFEPCWECQSDGWQLRKRRRLFHHGSKAVPLKEEAGH